MPPEMFILGLSTLCSDNKDAISVYASASSDESDIILYIYIYISLSLPLSIHPPTHPSTHLSTHPSIHPSIYPSIHIHLYIHIYIYIYMCVCICLYIVQPLLISVWISRCGDLTPWARTMQPEDSFHWSSGAKSPAEVLSILCWPSALPPNLHVLAVAESNSSNNMTMTIVNMRMTLNHIIIYDQYYSYNP